MMRLFRLYASPYVLVCDGKTNGFIVVLLNVVRLGILLPNAIDDDDG